MNINVKIILIAVQVPTGVHLPVVPSPDMFRLMNVSKIPGRVV